MSRTKKGGSSSVHNEYEGKRPLSWGPPKGRETKKQTHVIERAKAKQEIKKREDEGGEV